MADVWLFPRLAIVMHRSKPNVFSTDKTPRTLAAEPCAFAPTSMTRGSFSFGLMCRESTSCTDRRPENRAKGANSPSSIGLGLPLPLPDAPSECESGVRCSAVATPEGEAGNSELVEYTLEVGVRISKPLQAFSSAY